MSQQSQGRVLLVTGRIVWINGDLFQGEIKKDQNTRQPIIDQVTGLPKKEYGFGLAVPKNQLEQVFPPNTESLWSALHAEARTIYPSGHVPPQFSWKYKDGDGVDHNGQPFTNREGYANHLVLSLSTSIPIKFVQWDASMNTNVQINQGIKCGDYVTAQISIKAHAAVGQGRPGLYLNPYVVQLVGYGPEIIRTPSADTIFGMGAPQVPAGASLTPVANMASFPVHAAPQAPQVQQVAQYNQQPAVPQAPPVASAIPGVTQQAANYAGIPAHLAQPAVPQAPPVAPAIPGVMSQPVQGVMGAPAIPGLPQVPR